MTEPRGSAGRGPGDAWTPQPVTIGLDDHRLFAGSDSMKPLDRLARFVPADAATVAEPLTEGADEAGEDWIDPATGPQEDAAIGGTFVGLARGSLAGVPRVYVFVHGWLPGGLFSAQRSYAVDGRVARAWDADVTNRFGRSPVASYSPLLKALAERDPQAAVLWFSWVDQSGTDTSLFAARESLRHTAINGRRLAAALSQAIGGSDGAGSPGPEVHLIGHSHGCVVVSNAALALPSAPAHVTLLDCPEDWFSRTGGAAGLLTGTLPRLPPGRGPGATFVDAYATMFGRSYHDDPGLSQVVDVRVSPVTNPEAVESKSSQAHQYAVRWYTETVGRPDAVAGFAWSPLHGFDTTGLAGAYLLTKGGRLIGLPAASGGREESSQHLVTSLPVTPQRLTVRAPDVSLLLDLPQDALFVEFDIAFARCGRDARVDVAFDGHLSFTSYAAAPVPAHGRFVRVKAGRSALQFRLVDPGMLGSATISGLRVVRDPQAERNADDRAAMLGAAGLGAAAGSVATATLIASAWAGVRVWRLLRS